MSCRTSKSVLLLAAFLSPLLYAPASVEAAPSAFQPLPESDGCQVPASGGLFALAFPQLESNGFFAIPASTGEPHVVIPCVEFDRSAYLTGQLWGVTLTVTNAGNASSGEFSVYGQLCRHMSNGISLTCDVGAYPLATAQSSLEPQESRVITRSPSWGFSGLELDASGEYESWVEGFPDNGTVYLRAYVDTLGEYSTASAIYPSGPESAAGAAPGSVDADEDGYSPPDDCNDANPTVHPEAAEVVNDGINQDCSGDDPPDTDLCPGGSVIYRGECLASAPGAPLYPSILDMDGDSFSISEGDCDDYQFNVHPGAVEIQDDLDNNCNGEVDEVLGVPDFTVTAEISEGTAPNPIVGGATDEGIEYAVEVHNLGGGIPLPLENIRAVSIEAATEGTTLVTWLANGTSGFIPFWLMPETACSGGTIRFRLADNGIFGETNFSNNIFEYAWPGEGLIGPDLDIVFDDSPVAAYSNNADPTISLGASRVAEGSCPPMPISSTLVPMFMARHRVWLNGALIHNVTTSSEITYVELSQRLHRLDRVCAEVGLNDPTIVAEGTANNGWAGAYEFRTPLFGPDELRLVDSGFGDPGSLSCAAWSAGDGETPIVGAAAGALTGAPASSAPWLGGLGGAILLGAAGAGLSLFAGRRFAGVPVSAAVAAGGLAGIVVGGLSGALLLGAAAESVRRGTVLGAIPDAGEIAGLPSCDAYLDPLTASPGDGTVFFPGDTLTADLDLVPGVSPLPYAYTLNVEGPNGASFWSPWAAEYADPDALDLVGAAIRYPTSFSFSPGDYTWSVLIGLRVEGGNSIMCRDSTSHTFVIEGLTSQPVIAPETPAVLPTATPTPIPAVPVAPVAPIPTTPAPKAPTPTFTPPPDSSGPSIKSVSDAPDPIKVTQPKGCTPTTSTVSAAISDASGVASAYVLFFHTTIGQVPMTNSGGSTWTATLGPYSGIGDGTADYQIHAVDTLGNASDSTFGQVTVLACIP